MRHEAHLALWTLCLAALAFTGLMSVHFSLKPKGLDWAFYDPSFLFAFSGDLEKLQNLACNRKHVFILGSSTIARALTQTTIPKTHWEHHSINFKNEISVNLVKRTGPVDLRLFSPIFNRLPECPKVIILHDDMFLRYRDFKGKPAEPAEPKEYIRSSIIFFRNRIERLWPVALQEDFDFTNLRFGRHNCRSEKCFERFKRKRVERLEGFDGIALEHKTIVESLINQGAKIIILDIGRSQSLEKENQDLENFFRKSTQEYASTNPDITHLSFKSLDDDFYYDFKHLNTKGTQKFRAWFEPVLMDALKDKYEHHSN